MYSGQRSFVTSIHSLQHVEGFLAADFADNYPVRAHTQTVDEQLALHHGAFALNVRRPSFEAHAMPLLQLQFS